MARHVWITGASLVLGRAAALEYARRGWLVSITARSAAALDELAGSAPKSAPKSAPGIVGYPGDITDRDGMAALVARIEAERGPIDLAILNAGTHQPMDARRFDPTVFDRLIGLNLGGTVNCLAPLVPAMVARRAGKIAIVASVAGYRGLPTAAAYGASKAALINMAEALHLELKPAGVAVALVNPGFIRTPLTDRNSFPMPFLMEADAAARRLADGLDGSAFEITFPRRFTWMLKLLRILPYRLYFALAARTVPAERQP